MNISMIKPGKLVCSNCDCENPMILKGYDSGVLVFQCSSCGAVFKFSEKCY